MWGTPETTHLCRIQGPSCTSEFEAPFSFTRLGNGVAWIAQDTRRGTRQAVQAVGYQPVPVSNPAVEAAWGKYPTIADAVSYTLMYQGHELWVISFPAANATWCYDATTGWWFQWGFFNGSSWDRHLVWVHLRGGSRRDDGRALRRGLGERQHLHRVARLPDGQRIHHGAKAQIAP